MTSLHTPVPDRLLGPLARPLAGSLPALTFTLLSLSVAAAAFGLLVSDQRLYAGVAIVLTALLDAAAGITPPGASASVGDGDVTTLNLAAPAPKLVVEVPAP